MTRPVVIELSQVAQRYNDARSAESEAALERAINSAAIAVSRLVDVIRAWRTTSAIDEIEAELERIIEERPVYAVAA